MDGLSDSFSAEVTIWADYLDRLVHGQLIAAGFAVTTTVYFITWGNWFDFFLATLILYPKAFSLRQIVVPENIGISSSIFFGLLLLIILGIISSSSKNGNAGNTFVPPVFIPSRTTHTRFFPKKHSFSYSYLTVGIPVGLKGRANTLLSVDTSSLGWNWLQKVFSFTPFTVDGTDYLARGVNNDGLRGKLEEFLQSEVGYQLELT